MREALSRIRIPIALAVLIGVLAVSFWLHREETKPFYEVAQPYPAYEMKQIGGMCAFTAIRWVSFDNRYNPLNYCRCYVEHIQANATVSELKAAIAKAKSESPVPGQQADLYTKSAFRDCNRRLGLKTAGDTR